MDFLNALRQSRLLAILRGIEFDELPTLADACKSAGLGFVEITMNTVGATAKLAELTRLSEGAFRVGAGTVLSAEEARQAIDAGATFLVSPVLVEEVVQEALTAQVPYLPGALTPQEIFAAHRAGAAIVKVFPVHCLGPSYLRELRGPFRDIPLLACGGIRPDNIVDYLQAGADAVAVGGSTFRREWLSEKNVKALSQTLQELVKLASC